MIFLKRFLSPVVAFSFIIQSSFPIYAAQNSLLNLPEPGKMISLSSKFVPAYVKGISIYPNDPFKFDFIIDTGNTKLNDQQFKDESNKLIKYFMAALTVPEKEDWVNLSPYEKDRIVPESLGITEMGRDMLAQDYILKQLTSSLIYPEKEIGKEFWNKVYAQAQKQFGTTNIPVNTFNKVWIVPSQAVVWEHDNSAYVVRSHLKVMLEQDYLSLNKHLNNNIFSGSGMDQQVPQATNAVGSDVVRAVVLPALEKEVNEGANFAALRQVFNSAILAAWYKQNLKQTILGQVYANQNKVTGIDLADKQVKQQIYDRYLQAFKKGVFNFIKEDNDPATGQTVPRKYFSGGVTNMAMTTAIEKGAFDQLPLADEIDITKTGGSVDKVTVEVIGAANAAMLSGATPFAPVEHLPGFANALQAQHLSIQKVEVSALRVNAGTYTAAVLSDVATQEAVNISISQALGSILMAGHRVDAVKKPSDANAVHMGHLALIDAVKRNEHIAFVGVGSEGVRDESVGTPLGRFYWSGYGEENGYMHDTQKAKEPVKKAAYEDEVKRLRELGVQLVYFYDDGLENTNAQKDGEKDAWSVTAFEYDNPALPPRHLLDESDLRRVSVVANTPIEIKFEATDSPKQILEKLAAGFNIHLYAADGITPSEEGKAFASRIRFGLLGERKAENVKASDNKRHAFYFSGILELQAQGFPVTFMEFGDGDLMPGIVAASGIVLDDNNTIAVKVGRSGLVEAEVMDIAASLIPKARNASRVVSDQTTRSSVNPETIPTVQDGLLDKLVEGYGYTPDTFTVERNNLPQGTKKIVAMTAVTGADAERYYQGFAGMLPAVTFNSNDNTVTTSTLLITAQGVFVIRSTLKAEEGLAVSKMAILNASKEAQEYVQANQEKFDFIMLADTQRKARLVTTVSKMVNEEGAVIALDESAGTAGRRLAAYGLENTPENRAHMRLMFLGRAGDLHRAGINAAILDKDTFNDEYNFIRIGRNKVGLVDYTRSNNIVVGLKTDAGLGPDLERKGLEDLPGLLDQHGNKIDFTKWRVVHETQEDQDGNTVAMPTEGDDHRMAKALAVGARVTQERGIVPMVEPEFIFEKKHYGIDVNYKASTQMWRILAEELAAENVYLPGTILKTNMITSGQAAENPANPEEVAHQTLKGLLKEIPAELGAVVFLSGGQNDDAVNRNLDAINRAAKTKFAQIRDEAVEELKTEGRNERASEVAQLRTMPWKVSFSFSRGLEQQALNAWQGKRSNIPAAQEAGIKSAQTTRAASQGVLKEHLVNAAQIADRAVVAASHDPLGGINLDAALYNMQVQRDGKGMVLPISQQPIGQFMKIKGFKPVLLNIERNINLPARLGVNLNRLPKEQLAQASSVAG